MLLVCPKSDQGGAGRVKQSIVKGKGRASGLEKFYYYFFFFKYCVDIENCGSFRGSSVIYIYIYIHRLVCNPCLHTGMMNYNGAIDINLGY